MIILETLMLRQSKRKVSLMQARKAETKGDMRRRQVIDAAADCFRREGFHGTSIAQISLAAGMSPGHIYHYFANKESIVEAIVAQEESDFAELLQLLNEECGSGDFLDALSRQVDAIVDRILDPQRVALTLEIGAEAARNPKIANLLQESDRRMARQFADLAGALGEVAVADIENPASRTRLEMLPLLLSGLALRSVYNPSVDRPLITRMIKQTLAVLWRHGA